MHTQNRSSRVATVQIFKKNDKTYESDELASHARWSYYISTYSMLDSTEGMPLDRVRWPLLKRNTAGLLGDDEDSTNAHTSPQWNEDNLVVRISTGNYHILYDPDGYEWWVHSVAFRKRGLAAYDELSKERKRKFESLFGEKGSFISNKEGAKPEEENEEFRRWIRDGPAGAGDRPVQGQRVGGVDGANDGDEPMGGT